MYHLLSVVFEAVRGAFMPAWRWVTEVARQRHRRAVARGELRSIDEHTLRDIGLSHRAAAESKRVRDVW